MTSIHFPLNTNKTIFFLSFFSFHDLQVVDTSGPPPARHAPSTARLGGRPLLRSCTDCCCWAPWPWRTGGWDPRGSLRRSSCHSGCQTVTGWRRKAPPKKKRKKRGWSPSFTLLDDGTCRGRSYVCRWSFLVLGHAALQVEGQVVAVHQHALAKLLLKLLHVRLDSREVKFLMEAQRRRVGAHGWMEMSKTFADHIQPDLHMITWVSGSRVNSFSLVSLRRLRDSMSLVLWGEDTKFKPAQTTMKPCLVCPSWTRANMTTMLLPSQPHWHDGDRLDQRSWFQAVTVGSTQFNSKELFRDFRQIKGSFALLAIGSKQAGTSKLIC